MSKYGVLVMGPAGSGKTTFCTGLLTHLSTLRRSSFYINLDPAATSFPTHTPDLDIRELITLEDVMTEMGLGPNGGLIYCFEFLLENLDFLTEALDPVTEDCLIVIDMPGQIELYTHIPILPTLIRHLTRTGALNINLCATYLLESTFVVDRAKYFAGVLSAMSAMVMLEIPHVNVLSKMDLVRGSMSRRELKRFIDPDVSLLDEGDDPDRVGDREAEEDVDMGERESGPSDDSRNVMRGTSFKRLNRAVAGLIDEFSMVSFLQLDVQSEDSVGAILSYVDDAIQYHEAQEPKEPKEMDDMGDEGDT